MALQGTLETFSLADVLNLLASTKKTGLFRIEGERGSGELVVVDGELVEGSATGAPRARRSAEVLFELLRYVDGSFVFETDAGVAVDPDARRENIEEALADAEEQLHEWQEIEAVVGSPTRRVSLVARREASITLNPEQWSCIVVLSDSTTTNQLAERLDLAELPACRLVRQLVELGAVEIGDEVETGDDVDASAPPSAPSEVGTLPAEVDDVAPPAAAGGLFSFARLVAAPDELAPPELSPPVGLTLVSAPEDEEVVGWNEDPEMRPRYDDDDESRTFPGSTFLTDDDPFGPDPFIPRGFNSSNDEGSETESTDDEMARQLASLSPRAQEAVAAAAAAGTDVDRDEAIAEAEREADEPVNRSLLLKYFSSVNK